MNEGNEKTTAETQAEEEHIETPQTIEEKEVLIPIKFNKEVKNISLEEAATLAQKGMKYDIIYKEYETLKELALGENKSVAEYLESLKNARLESRKNELLEKCGGDSDLAEHFLMLEQAVKKETENDFGELREYFPAIKEIEQLPEEVVESSRLKGSSLLDEYLRYQLREKRNRTRAEAETQKADKKSMGSLQNKNGGISPEAVEFLKGLWK